MGLLTRRQTLQPWRELHIRLQRYNEAFHAVELPSINSQPPHPTPQPPPIDSTEFGWRTIQKYFSCPHSKETGLTFLKPHQLCIIIIALDGELVGSCWFGSSSEENEQQDPLIVCEIRLKTADSAARLIQGV